MAVAPAKNRDAKADAPDLSHFRRHYPLTVANFGALADREAWLRRIWEADARWREASSGGAAREVIARGAPPAKLAAEGEFDLIYAGGSLAVLHAALLACRHGRRVLVVLAPEGGGRGPDRAVSDADLDEFARAGLLTAGEIEAAVVNRRRAGFVKFYDARSRVKAPPLWVGGVSDVTVDAARLAASAAAKLAAREGCAVVEGARFVRAFVERDRVSVEFADARGSLRLFAARLFVDASGADSAVARQLNGGRAATHVRPAVGTVARGFTRGGEAGQVDFSVGEILVSTEDAGAHRQLMWEGFGRDARAGDYSTRLFFYDSADSPADKSLLALFEQYFEKLPRYKRAGAQWRVVRPVFGHAASTRPAGWRARRAGLASDRVLLAGDAAGGASPLAVSDFGAHLRGLGRSAQLVELALSADLLDARSLSEIGAHAPARPAQSAGLAEFLRPAPQGDPATVNETLNAVMAALHDLDERVRRELFEDSLSFAALKSLLGRTLQLYPRLLQRVRERLGARGTLWWLAHAAGDAYAVRRARTAGRDDAAARDEEAEDELARRLALYKDGGGD